MLNQTSTTAIARIVLLAGILLAFAFLASRSFFPKVTNKDEDGTVTLSTLQPLEGIYLVATLTDPDGRVGADGEVEVPAVGKLTSTPT